MADSVQLTDLDVITRYSIAVRSATADRDELIATLRADLSWLERGSRGRAAAPVVADEIDEEYDEEPAKAPRRAPARRATTTRKTAVKKAAARRSTR